MTNPLLLTPTSLSDNNVMEYFNNELGSLGPLLISGKLEQQAILEQSAMDGGPTNVSDAFVHLMDYLKIGYRELARQTGRPRKKLQDMIEGKKPMPPEVVSELHAIFTKKKPELFK